MILFFIGYIVGLIVGTMVFNDEDEKDEFDGF